MMLSAARHVARVANTGLLRMGANHARTFMSATTAAAIGEAGRFQAALDAGPVICAEGPS